MLWGFHHLVGFLSRKTQIQIMARGNQFLYTIAPFVKTKQSKCAGLVMVEDSSVSMYNNASFRRPQKPRTSTPTPSEKVV